MSIADVRKALFDHLETLPVSPALDIVDSAGVPYKPKVGRPYLEVVFAPNETNTDFVGDDDPKRYEGFLQVTVVAPRADANFDPYEVAGTIISHYKKGTRLSGGPGVVVKILREPWASQPIPDEGWRRVPVSIPYRSMI